MPRHQHPTVRNFADLPPFLCLAEKILSASTGYCENLRENWITLIGGGIRKLTSDGEQPEWGTLFGRSGLCVPSQKAN